MTRSAWTLAALADAAVPGLRPQLVEELVDRVGERFRAGFVEDTEGRRWVVRVPADAVAAAQLEESSALAGLLSGKLPFDVPQSTGAAALRDGRRAVVYPLIAGRCVDFGALPPGPGLTARIVAAIAAVHNLDRRLFEEAGVPAYEAEDLRRRRQADVDRGAATGLVPTGLLARWERMLDDVSWWRFAPSPVHGRLQDDHVLLRFDDPQDADAGRVVGITSWENAQIADPAQDLAALLALCPASTVETVLEAYAGARREPPDAHLADRAGLLAELEYLNELLTARRLGDRRHLTQATEALRRLDDVVSHGHGNRSGTAVDRLPVDFEPDSSTAELYQAGGPTRRIGETAEVEGTNSWDAGSRAGSEPSAGSGNHGSADGESRDRESGDREAKDREAGDRQAKDPEAGDREVKDREAEDHGAEDREAGARGSDRTAPMPVVGLAGAPPTPPQEPVPTAADPGSSLESEPAADADPRARAHADAVRDARPADGAAPGRLARQEDRHPASGPERPAAPPDKAGDGAGSTPRSSRSTDGGPLSAEERAAGRPRGPHSRQPPDSTAAGEDDSTS